MAARWPAIGGIIRAMISGQVNHSLQAVVAVTIIGSAGQRESVEVVLDTGFQGYLVLPPATIRSLGLEYPAQDGFTLADGQRVQLDTYIATVIWHDRPRLVIVLESETPLLGTFLLWGSRVCFDLQESGPVTIEELSL